MLAVGTWGNDEVSPADIRVGKEGIFAALIVCVEGTSSLRERCSEHHPPRTVAWLPARLEQGPVLSHCPSTGPDPTAKCARDLLLFWELSTSRI